MPIRGILAALAASSDGDRPASVPLTPYQRRLIVFLSVATFFEGFDLFALPQILPGLRQRSQADRFMPTWVGPPGEA